MAGHAPRENTSSDVHMHGTYCVELFSVEHRKFGIPGNISGTVCLLCLDPNHNKDLRTCKQATIPHIHIKTVVAYSLKSEIAFFHTTHFS